MSAKLKYIGGECLSSLSHIDETIFERVKGFALLFSPVKLAGAVKDFEEGQTSVCRTRDEPV
jgi:hypothetical protein